MSKKLMTEKVSIFSKYFWANWWMHFKQVLKYRTVLMGFSFVIAIAASVLSYYFGGNLATKIYFIISSIFYFLGANTYLYIGTMKVANTKHSDSLTLHFLYGIPSSKIRLNWWYGGTKLFFVFFKVFLGLFLFPMSLLSYQRYLNKIIAEDALAELEKRKNNQ